MILFSCLGCSVPTIQILNVNAMGTTWVMKYQLSGPGVIRINNLLKGKLTEMDSLWSSYEEHSLVNKIASKSGDGEWITVDTLTYDLLKKSTEVSQLTNGLFDVTAHPLIREWKRGITLGKLPDSLVLKNAQGMVGFKNMLFKKDNKVRLAIKGSSIDLGGIGKGYALDVLAHLLKAKNIQHFIIDAGGDIITGLPFKGKEGFNIKCPSGSIINVKNMAVATSGNTYQQLKTGNIIYQHHIDPLSGMASSHNKIISVAHLEGWKADAFSTALSVDTTLVILDAIFMCD